MLNNVSHSSSHLAGSRVGVDSSGPDMDLFRSSAGNPAPYLPDAMNSTLSQALRVEYHPKVTEENARQVLKSVAIDPTEDLAPPSVCLEVVQNGNHATIGTLGNFSLVIGKAKSRKTFFITMVLAAAVKSDFVLGQFKGTLPENQGTVLFFDTEQGKYHVQKAVKRTVELSGVPEPANFIAYGLRKFSPAERLALIETAIYDTPNLGGVVIDGVRDLVTSINDEEQATMLASKLLKWSEEKGIHIVCVLHRNKGDNNARGHLGSELQNKAETVLSVTKSSDNKDISIVEPELCREKEFEPFAFSIDEHGLPRLEVNWVAKPEGQNNGNGKKTKSPMEIPPETHREVLKMAFKNNPKPRHAELIPQLKLALEIFSITVGDTKTKEFKTYYENESLIEQHGKSGTRNSYYTLNELG